MNMTGSLARTGQAHHPRRQLKSQSKVRQSHVNMQSMGATHLEDGNRSNINTFGFNQAASVVPSNNRRRQVGQSLVLTQTRTPNPEAITSHPNAHVNQLRRSQKVGTSKTKTVQQVDNEKGLSSTEEAAAAGAQHGQQLF